MTAIKTEQIELICAAALSAPSADNRHVFRIQARNDALDLLATGDLVNAPRNRRTLGLMSIGAVSLNLELRAARLGLRLEPQWNLGGSGSALLARFHCHAVDAVDDPLEEAIDVRHTNRRLRFRGPPLPRHALDRMSAHAASTSGTALVWLEEPDRRRHALKLMRWAEVERFRNESLHRELFDSIRFDLGWDEPAAVGLPPGALALAWFERPTFGLLRHWGVQRAVNRVGMHHFLGWRAADLPCRLAPHLCAIYAEGEVDTAAVNAGRLLQRLWLEATCLGLSFQPFAASPVYAHDRSDSISEDLRHRLASGWSELSRSGRPFIVCRLGHAEPPPVRTSRPALRSVV